MSEEKEILVMLNKFSQVGCSFVLRTFLFSCLCVGSAHAEFRIQLFADYSESKESIDPAVYRVVKNILGSQISSDKNKYKIKESLPSTIREECEDKQCKERPSELYEIVKKYNLNREFEEGIDWIAFYSLSRFKAKKFSYSYKVSVKVHDLNGHSILSRAEETANDKARIKHSNLKLDIETFGSLTNELAYKLTEGLDREIDGGQYVLEFFGFSSSEIRNYKEELKLLENVEYIRSGKRVVLAQYLHEEIDPVVNQTLIFFAKDHKAFFNFLDQEFVLGRPVKKGISITYPVRMNHTRHVFTYILLLLIPLGLYVAAYYRLHHRSLAKLSVQNKPLSGLEYLKKRRVSLLPATKKWQEWYRQWKEIQMNTEQALENSRKAIEVNDYDKAIQLLAEAKKNNIEHEEVNSLLDELPQLKEGFNLFQEAESCIESLPSTAAKKFKQAADLNAYLQSKALLLMRKAEMFLREGDLKKNVEAAEQLLIRQDFYKSIYHVDTAKSLIAGLDDFRDEMSSLNRLRANVEESLISDARVLGISGDCEPVKLLVSQEVFIGRPDSQGKNDIEIGFDRISRYGKQAKLVLSESSVQLHDLGSSNGSYVDAECLPPHGSATIHDGSKISFGGNRDGDRGICVFKIQAMPYKSIKNYKILLDDSSLTFLNQAQLKSAWSSVESDVKKLWYTVNGKLPIGEYDGKLDLGCQYSDNPVYYLTAYGHLGLEPVNPGETSDIKVDGVPVLASVPLKAGSVITLGDKVLQINAF
jgi:pSer/pThr/pTyr-binding forkhead associated (FHA) protein